MRVYLATNGTDFFIFSRKSDAVKKCREDGRVLHKGYYVYEKDDINEYDFQIKELELI